MTAHQYKGIGIGKKTVKGAVYRLNDVDDSGGKGKILVLDYPSIAYGNAIRQSLGFIAEQGGLGSHGCTLALELGLPVVVGIARARQLLHDGDLVELDAAEGVVREL